MSVPILSVAQMRDWERATWAAGQTEAVVIARVGEYLARRALGLTRSGDSILILAGRGHNGDDARAMLPHIAGREVETLPISDPAAALPQLVRTLARRPSLIVDGLFGIGLSRELDGDWQSVIRLVNEARRRVLAIDVPSGLDAESGEPRPEAIRASVTVTVGAPKRGMLTASAVEFVGRLEVASDVGLAPCSAPSELHWALPEDFAAFPPGRKSNAHKGTFGHVAVVAGSLGYHGAAVLAAHGAQRARPGLITLFTPPECYAPVAAQLQSVMVHPWDGGLEQISFTAALFGPGLAAKNLPPTLREVFVSFWRQFPGPVIVDASALEWLMPGDSASGCRVITPHPGEAARLLGRTAAEVQDDRPAALRELSKRFGHCWVVLKGQHTLIGRESGEIFVNSSGNPGLAQGGSGDLLAGFIAGWLGQPAARQDVLMPLRYAVFEHGAAADRSGERRQNWIIEELAEELGRIETSK
jgi:NAD(P)H-hydrate epimerase